MKTKLTSLFVLLLLAIFGTSQNLSVGLNSSFVIDQDKFYYLTLVENNEVLENPDHKEAKLITSQKRSGDDSQLWRFIKVEDNLYMIVNKKQKRFMDIPFNRKNAGETLIGYRNKGGINQQFHLVSTVGNVFHISSKLSGLALTTVKSKEEHCLYREKSKTKKVISTTANTVNDIVPPFDNPVDNFSGNMACPEGEVTANYLKQMPLTGGKNQQWRIVLAN